jgi:GNAT superfamily N-acetyltransferase
MQTMVTIARIRTLPDDMENLVEPAHQEGYRFMRRLIDEFESGSNTFTHPGEALFEVRIVGKLVGIAGLNIDPYAADGAVGRVRRMYVHPDHRCHGIGTALIEAIEKHARDTFDLLQLRTDSDAASRFYASVGFIPLHGVAEATHAKRLRD